MAIAIAEGIPFQSDTTTECGCIGFKKAGKALVPCGKVTAPGSARCPRCEVLAADEAAAPARRAEKRDAQRKAREEELAFLASSPLAAVNPKFAPTASERRLSRRPHAVRSLMTVAADEHRATAKREARTRSFENFEKAVPVEYRKSDFIQFLLFALANLACPNHSEVIRCLDFRARNLGFGLSLRP
jgi:hypothetical protein